MLIVPNLVPTIQPNQKKKYFLSIIIAIDKPYIMYPNYSTKTM